MMGAVLVLRAATARMYSRNVGPWGLMNRRNRALARLMTW